MFLVPEVVFFAFGCVGILIAVEVIPVAKFPCGVDAAGCWMRRYQAGEFHRFMKVLYYGRRFLFIITV